MWKYSSVRTQFVADMYSESMWETICGLFGLSDYRSITDIIVETGGVYYYTRK